MCGIIAFKYTNEVPTSNNNTKNQAIRKKIDAIFTNQMSRGIKGAGMSVKTTNNNKVQFYRARSEDATHFFTKSEEKFATLKKGDLVLLHHRYPTTNDNGSETTHPFMNENKDISLIHNGMINNHKSLYEELINKGHLFESDIGYGITDSEVILHEFEEGLEGKRTEKAITKSLERLHKKLSGGFAIAITMKGSNKIWLTRSSNPIEIYSDRYGIYASSEKPNTAGFVTEHTMQEGEIGYINENGYEQVSKVNKYYDMRSNYYDRGVTEDDTEAEGFGSFSNQLDEELRQELYKERENLRCYTRIPETVEDLLSDMTGIVHDSKKINNKGRAKYLTKKVWEAIEHYAEKLRNEAQDTEEMMVKYEEHIDKMEEEIKILKTEMKNMEYDIAEWKASYGIDAWDYDDEMEMRAWNESFNKNY